jgi:beta-ureidopropionase / N-carbamoyl-L-amino-acid hydrolase
VTTPERFRQSFDGLAAVGRSPAGGWNRFAWTVEDAAARAWFRSEAARVGGDVEQDANGNLWAWWWPAGTAAPVGSPATVSGAVATGSHLDTVPEGGAYDGALGVVAGFLAVEDLLAGDRPLRRPVAVVDFADEEGARFGLSCVGSRLAVGATAPDAARPLADATGTTMADAMAAAGVDPDGIGAEPLRIGRLAAFVEVHVEQGRGLVDLGAPVAVGTGIWPHGRWRCSATGEANHAGTTRLEDRRDPAMVLAAAVTAARRRAREADALATVGRVTVTPNGTNVVPSVVDLWLDARAPDDATLDRLVAGWEEDVRAAAGEHGVDVDVAAESRTAAVPFDTGLRSRMATLLDAPDLPTGAGHDAGILAAAVPSAMLFVRNPTGVSHSPAESAADDDCVAGVAALAAVLADLAC